MRRFLHTLRALRLRSPPATQYSRLIRADTGGNKRTYKRHTWRGIPFHTCGGPLSQQGGIPGVRGKNHQCAATAISYMAYIVRRFGNLIRPEDGVDTKSQLADLFLNVECLARRLEKLTIGPSSYVYANKRSSGKRIHLGRALALFRNQRRVVTTLPGFRENGTSIPYRTTLQAIFENTYRKSCEKLCFPMGAPRFFYTGSAYRLGPSTEFFA